MKNKVMKIGIIVLIAVIGLTMASCGDNPKSLAKQTYDLTMQIESLSLTDYTKMIQLSAKIAAIEVKVMKLSEKDLEIYLDELFRLGGYSMGDFGSFF